MAKHSKSAASDRKIDFSAINNYGPSDMKKPKTHGFAVQLKQLSFSNT
jgi:hypothetical protein